MTRRMHPTRRRNGEHMITVKITHHLDRSALHHALVLAAYLADDGYTDRDLSRAAVEAIVRTELGIHGAELGGDGTWESIDEHPDHATWHAWADRQLDRLWPEMTTDTTQEG